ncbi:MAG TPA: hypothetical protein VFE47_20930 [Tepidisphaeraceae bacterium]|jgi:hypothetical protein|nr:hypothetical protein [Tepidisphaeraceae bacterium]
MRQMLCGLACLLCAWHIAAAVTVSTDDGLALQFQEADASISGVTVQGKSLKLNASPGGFYVADMIGDKLLGKMNYKSEAFPATRLAATARSSPTGVVIEGKVNDLWIRARIEPRGDYLSITGDLVNLRPDQDRAAILYFRVPIDATGASWGKNLGIEEPIAAAPHRYINPSYFHQGYRPAMSRLPIGTLSGDGWGLSMVQPMDVPRFFRLTYEQPYGFQIEYEFGLSPVTWKFRNRAPFQFLLYRHDPAWGLRSAFERYYQFFPGLFRKVVRDGLWIDDWEGKRKTLGDAADFGIVFNETGGWADEQQRSHDVLSMKYIEPWCDHIEATPDQVEAMARDLPENHKEARFGRGADLRTNALELLNSGVYGPDGKILDPRTAAVGGFYIEGKKENPYYRYLTNPDPELPTPFGGLNRAQKISRYDLYTAWGKQTKEHQYQPDGIYYDSIGGAWAGAHLQNFRRDHMPTVDVPLTFDHKTGKVTITHGFSSIKYLRYCTLQARQEGRPTMGNSGAGDFLPFVAPWLDMGGAGENYEYEADYAGQREMRAQMHAKPLSYLNNAELGDAAKAEAVMDRLLMYACYPGAHSTAAMVSQRHLYRAYIPIYNALGAAGWEPVPYAHVTPNAADGKLNPWCERFGHGVGGYFFTVRNPGEATELTLTFTADELHRLNLEKPQFTAVTGCQIKSAATDRVVLAVPANWTAVIAINRDDAKGLAEANREEMKEQK